MKKISILIVNYNSSDFVSLSLFALSKLTYYPFDVFVLDNDSEIGDYRKLKLNAEKYENVYLERKKTNSRGSLAHAEGLNYLIKKVKTPYFCILDADATWLVKDWDKILISKLNKRVKVIGTEASNPTKSVNFPYIFAALFETRAFKTLDIDFRPKDIGNMQDTGYEMKEKYSRAKLIGMTLKFRNTRYYKKGPFKDLIVAEYYLEGRKAIFAGHFGRGSTLGSAKYQRGLSILFYSLPIFGRILLSKRGEREKLEWINICREIINKQSSL